MATPTLPAQGVKSREELAQLIEDAVLVYHDGDGERVLRALSDAGVVLVPREMTLEMVQAALAKTAGWIDIPGSQLTVAREKMRIRYRAALAASPFTEGK